MQYNLYFFYNKWLVIRELHCDAHTLLCASVFMYGQRRVGYIVTRCITCVCLRLCTVSDD